MPQLLRDNTRDPRVAADVERLASEYDEESIVAAATAAAHARSEDLALLSAAYADVADEGPAWWQVVAANVARYRRFYAAAIAIVGILVFRSPIPPPAIDDLEATTTIGDGEVAGAPAPSVAIDVGAFPTQGPLDLAQSDELSSPLAPASPGPVIAAPPIAPPVLRIAQSGYASTFAGTPLEQPPAGDGLPVEALAGSATKLSFVRLAGGGRTLRMRMLTDAGASLNDAVAEIQACHVTTANWTAARGMSTNEAPKYDSGHCVQAARNSAGVWSFSFVLDDPLDRNGWAIVPITLRNGTFRITFSPNGA